mmetsp:Transcript_26291/g.47105  ORF Transcript_26291/g.47105 Transcript_26291/m.47105 type:complete len:213 (+) Transcript_26291:1272-1910(+)
MQVSVVMGHFTEDLAVRASCITPMDFNRTQMAFRVSEFSRLDVVPAVQSERDLRGEVIRQTVELVLVGLYLSHIGAVAPPFVSALLPARVSIATQVLVHKHVWLVRVRNLFDVRVLVVEVVFALTRHVAQNAPTQAGLMSTVMLLMFTLHVFSACSATRVEHQARLPTFMHCFLAPAAFLFSVSQQVEANIEAVLYSAWLSTVMTLFFADVS